MERSCQHLMVLPTRYQQNLNGKGMSSTQTQDSITMKPIDQRDRTRVRSDIHTRRLKNRERQRRYRARKRLEAELNNSSTAKPSVSPDVQVQINGSVCNYTPRVHCKRNWKKDARRAHVSNDPEVTVNAYSAPTLMSTSACQAVFLSGTTAEPKAESETYSEASVDPKSSEFNRLKLGRRDWKAEARKKQI